MEDAMIPIFGDEFKKYVAEQKYVATRWFVYYRWTYRFEHPDSLTSAVVHTEYRRTVDELMRIETLLSCLIQFWRAEEERVVNNNSVGERRFLLTLRNQPFLLRGFYNLDGLYRYRTKMHDVIVNGDGTGGPIGRVFRNNRMEYTPNVLYYSDNEYPQPQRDIAKSCGIKCSLVLPWRDCNGGVVGAIEFVTLLELSLMYRLPSNMRHSNSRYSDYCGQYDSEKDSIISAVTEINKVIGEVCERHDVVRCAQIWMLCKHRNSLSTVKRCVGEQKALSENFIDHSAAESCHIEGSLVLPWRDCNGGVVGTIEFVSLLELPFLYRHHSNPLHNNSRYSDYCQRLCGQYDFEKDSLISAVTEINEVIGEVYERRDEVRYAQTWMLCKCNSLSTVGRCDEELNDLSKYFDDHDEGYFFVENQYYYNLKKGEGLVGKTAESSHDLVYCEDVAKFSITEYPLAHFARCYGYSASFAISLKSNQTGDRVYVLEFFLREDYVKGKNLRATLVPILEIIRQCFKTLKFASGGQIGDSLFVQVIDAGFSEKNENIEIETLQSSMKKQDRNEQTSDDQRGRESAIGLNNASTSQQSLVEVNVVHSEEKIEGPSEECIINSSKKPHKRGGIDISLEELRSVDRMKRMEAAQKLNVSVSTFKRICRDHGISRWPPREMNTDHQSCSTISAQTTGIEEPSAPTEQKENLVTIKAKYGDKFIKFQFSASSGIDVFHNQVSKRLNLEAKDYIINYQDEEHDWIIIACDDDLRYFISSSTSSGNNPLLVTLEHT